MSKVIVVDYIYPWLSKEKKNDKTIFFGEEHRFLFWLKYKVLEWV
jgi:hypothetical protein